MAKAEGKTFDYIDESHIGTDLLAVSYTHLRAHETV